MIDLSIVVPAYNEVARIGVTLERTLAFLAERPWSCEVIVVDDGSVDGTLSRAAEYVGRSHPVRCVANDRNRGKGFAVRHGVAEATGRFIGFMDADYKTDVAGLDLVMPLLEEGWDAVIGDRTLSSTRIVVARRRFRQWGSLAFRQLVHRLVGLGQFGDTQCGFKFFRAEVARDLFARQRIDGFMFDVEILLLAARLGYRVRPVPVTWSDDPDSRFNPVTGAVRDLAELLRIRWHHRRLRSR
ncbi:MAG: dolichyl-phosphate beta-glucosyltransferase [Candidatus Latescibacterota bacterium]